ncbi:MAG TPA: sialidase family protein [Candidatus Hydrogenedentes bacterium]|nr:sialidase family protein [Candidatus Hydrogenedentota bacterium]
MRMVTYLSLVLGVLISQQDGNAQAAATPATNVSVPETVLNIDPGDGNPRNSEGAFVQLNDGRILFAYTHFTGSAGDEGTAHIAGRFSSDNGVTWTREDQLILPNEGQQNTMSVSLLRLKSGPIAFFYLRKNSDADCRPYLRISTDEAKTWSEPQLCIEPVGYFVVNNDRVIQLSTGRLVIPAARHSLPGEKFGRRAQALCYLSDDDGKSWRQSETVLDAPPESKSGLQEPGIVELSDGRIMMLCRTDVGCQLRSYSADGGNTWSPVERTDIFSPVSPASFKRIPSTGGLLLVWNNHANIPEDLKNKRTPLSVAVSNDNGQSWQYVKNIETNPDGWYCYTAVEFTKDNHVLLGYCAGDKTIGGLNRARIMRIPVGWLSK